MERELDYFIKSKALHWADVQSETALKRRVAVLKAFRSMALDLADFLHQLEMLQAQLFEKKRLVYQTDYLVPMRFVPEDLWDEILANGEQVKEWRDWMGLEVSDKKTLATHPSLPLHTSHFPREFVRRLIQALPAQFQGEEEEATLDGITDGLLIHSENYGALRTLEPRYREKVKFIYIDPPYNTGSDEFIYKDAYRHSSWLSMMEERLRLARELMREDGVIFVSIDDNEVHHLRKITEDLWEPIGTFVWEKKKKGSHLSPTFRDLTEYVLAYAKDLNTVGELYGEHAYSDKWQPLIKRSNPERVLSFPGGVILVHLEDGKYPSGRFGSGATAISLLDTLIVKGGKIQNPFRMQARFVWTQETLEKELSAGSIIRLSKNMRPNVLRAGQEEKTKRPPSLITKDIAAYEDAFKELLDLFGEAKYAYPKPTGLVRFLVQATTYFSQAGIILDHFAGSGTTGHAVINLNREDGGRRKFILVEMGDYFDTVLVPRIAKVMYAPEWKDGKPKEEPNVDGDELPEWMERSPRLVKILRLESYEDALYNLVAEPSDREEAIMAMSQKEEWRKRPDEAFPERDPYLLEYFADAMTDGNPTMLRPFLQGELVDTWKDPDAIRIRRVKAGTRDGFEEQSIDWLETASLWLGLQPIRYEEIKANGRIYRILRTRKNGEDVAVVVRNAHGLNPHEDRSFLEGLGGRVIVNDPPVPAFEALEDALREAMMEGPR